MASTGEDKSEAASDQQDVVEDTTCDGLPIEKVKKRRKRRKRRKPTVQQNCPEEDLPVFESQYPLIVFKLPEINSKTSDVDSKEDAGTAQSPSFVRPIFRAPEDGVLRFLKSIEVRNAQQGDHRPKFWTPNSNDDVKNKVG